MHAWQFVEIDKNIVEIDKNIVEIDKKFVEIDKKLLNTTSGGGYMEVKVKTK